MSFVSKISPYKTVRAEVYGGGRVKIEIRRELLNPAGKDIIAILQFNGTKVYIPKNAEITIGTLAKCDIRINDPTIEFMHLLISAGPKNVSVHNLSFERKTGLFDRKNNEARVLSPDDSDVVLEKDSDIMFPLNGVNRYLNMVLNIKEESAEAMKANIALQLAEPRPPIEQVGIETALVKREKQEILPNVEEQRAILMETAKTKNRNLGSLLAYSGAAIVGVSVPALSICVFFSPALALIPFVGMIGGGISLFLGIDKI